eukprot:4049847-Pleurochrysis_carterae.AAC.1
MRRRLTRHGASADEERTHAQEKREESERIKQRAHGRGNHVVCAGVEPVEGAKEILDAPAR